ncbi:hypothetical protein JZ751_026400, partial [Albula glossodonta]
MPVRRGHVAPQNTYLDTIIRKFDGQNRKFLIANAQMKNCGIIYCNEGFCQMFGFSRAEIMQQPCTCQFLVGPGTMKGALAQLAQALLGSEERKVEILYYAKEGQSGRLKLKLPSLHTLRQPSISKDQFEGVVVDHLQPSNEEVPLKEFHIPCKDSCMQSETEALIEQGRSSRPMGHSSPKWLPEHLDPDRPFPGDGLPRSRSRDSLRTLRRASSLDDIDSMRADWCGRGGDSRFNSNLKHNLLNSTSDSDLMRHRTISRIPQVTLTFGSDRLRPPSPAEIEIIAPSKVKDRTQNVTEKVTQASGAGGQRAGGQRGRGAGGQRAGGQRGRGAGGQRQGTGAEGQGAGGAEGQGAVGGGAGGQRAGDGGQRGREQGAKGQGGRGQRAGGRGQL